jgi:hypothetical protein
MDSTDGNKKRQDEIEREINNFHLPPLWPIQMISYFLYTFLAITNYLFFARTVAGIQGKSTGILAVIATATALYCTHNYPRSIGKHRLALGVWGILLTTLSVFHTILWWFFAK